MFGEVLLTPKRVTLVYVFIGNSRNSEESLMFKGLQVGLMNFEWGFVSKFDCQ